MGAIEQGVSAAPPQFREQVLDAANQAFVTALSQILLIGGVVAFVGALAGLALVRSRDFVPPAHGFAPAG